VRLRPGATKKVLVDASWCACGRASSRDLVSIELGVVFMFALTELSYYICRLNEKKEPAEHLSPPQINRVDPLYANARSALRVEQG
jgi:hypothetical protein